jgi:hypothetical protein
MKAPGRGRAQGEQEDTTSGSANRSTPLGLQFLKRRYADAITRGDDAHGDLLRPLLDLLLNGRLP